MATYGIHKLCPDFILDVDQEVRRWWAGTCRLLEDFFDVIDGCHSFIVVFTPDTCIEVKDVNPIMPCIARSPMDEHGCKLVRDLGEVLELVGYLVPQVADRAFDHYQPK